jgi:hypothetical protein
VSELGFEIRDPAIDEMELARRVEKNTPARRARAAELGLDFEAMSTPMPASQPEQWLALAWLSCHAIRLQADTFETIAHPWYRPLRWLRRQIHKLVTYYTNRLGYRQMVFNIGVLQVLEHHLYEQQALVRDLSMQVADLEARLHDLQQPRK